MKYAVATLFIIGLSLTPALAQGGDEHSMAKLVNQYLSISLHMMKEANDELSQGGDPTMSRVHYNEALAYDAAACNLGRRTDAATDMSFVEHCARNEADISKQPVSDASHILLEASKLELVAQSMTP